MKKAIIITIILIGVSVILYLVIYPTFNTQEVNDTLPEESVGSQIKPNSNPEMASGFEKLPQETQKEMTKQMNETGQEKSVVMDDKITTTASPDDTSEPTSSQVTGTFGHPASGSARVVETANGSVVRFENFKTLNGPQLHVYLKKDLGGDDFIDLGPIRGTAGNINYSIPEHVDLSEYKYVTHWCVPFGVLFNYAEIN